LPGGAGGFSSSSLQAAGLLQEKLGGPSVKPYQPDGLWNELAMQDMYYTRSNGADHVLGPLIPQVP